MIKRPTFLAAVFAVNAVAQAESNSADIVADYYDAYNAHDIELMLTMLDNNVRWMSITDEGMAVVTSDRAELADGLEDYFAEQPSARSVLRSVQRNRNFVTVVEESIWDVGSETRSQCAVAVYEIKNVLIVNVWYFREQPCDD